MIAPRRYSRLLIGGVWFVVVLFFGVLLVHISPFPRLFLPDPYGFLPPPLLALSVFGAATTLLLQHCTRPWAQHVRRVLVGGLILCALLLFAQALRPNLRVPMLLPSHAVSLLAFAFAVPYVARPGLQALLGQMLAIGALGNSLRELLIFMLSATVLPISSSLTSLALLFCAGMLLAYTQPSYLFTSLQRSDLSGFAARFLLLPAFVFPLLTLLLSRAVPQPSPFGIGFGSLLLLLFNLGLIVWFAEVLHANELRRQHADQQRVVIDQHMMLITDQLPAILWTTDRDLCITAIHGSALMPFSRDPAAFLGQGIDHIMGSVQLASTSAAHQRALAGQSSSYEHDIGQRRFDIRTDPLRDHQGQIVGVIGLALDSTERREMEAAIFQLNTVLEQRVAERTNQLTAVNDELEAFSYSVSHDLRAPLRSMINYSQALEEDFAADLPPEARAYLERIRSSGERMNLLITDLLALAQVTRLPLHAVPVSLSDLAQTIIAELQQADPERNATITVQPDLWVLGDLRLLEVALRNLLGNAWKFTAKRPHTQIRLFATQHDDEWQYHIGDNGAGFPAEQAQRLFEPFRRFHHERDFPGTGIGLATVKRVITRHGGRIWALSTPDQGATFSFSLPALPPPTADSLHSREEIYAPATAPADD